MKKTTDRCIPLANNRPNRPSPCCGRRTQDVVCCAIDPRALADGRRSKETWCCWCGDDVPEGRSYCNDACSREYHEDVFAASESWFKRSPREA